VIPVLVAGVAEVLDAEGAEVAAGTSVGVLGAAAAKGLEVAVLAAKAVTKAAESR
jgi:hypothetical protein